MSEIISSQKELIEREKFQQLYKDCPISVDELMYNMGLFISRQYMMRMLFIHELYQKILNVHGVIMEFGVRWGGNMALYESFHGIYEPYNYNRKIVGFDTFESFPSIHEKDGNHTLDEMKLTEDYEKYLGKVLHYHETESPIPQIQKFWLVKGDACQTVPKYFTDHPETIVSLAYLDFDIYEPTKAALFALKGHLTKGSIIALDEAGHPDWPGESLALFETIGIENIKLQHSKYSPNGSYFVVE
jgi:hypothetical protein